MADAIEVFRYEPPPGFVDPATCAHEDTVPVFAYSLGKAIEDLEVGDEVAILNDARPVAHLCRDCDAQLEPGWGCVDCEWESYAQRRMCDPKATIQHVLVRPCKEHA